MRRRLVTVRIMSLGILLFHQNDNRQKIKLVLDISHQHMTNGQMLRLVTFLLSAFFMLSGPAWANQALEITGMRFGDQDNNRTRIVIETNHEADFNARITDDPRGMIVKLPEFEWKIDNTSLKPPVFIDEIKFSASRGEYKSVLFKMNDMRVIDSAFLLPGKGEKPTRLVIDLKPANRITYKQQLDVIHGTISEDRQRKSTASKVDKNDFVIVIDPGHGGHDPGAVGANKLKEKDVVLHAAEMLRDTLKDKYTVHLTRNEDHFIPLYERIAIAHEHKADLFISIHADSIADHNVRGASIYTLSSKATDPQTAALAIRENKAGLMDELGLPTDDQDIASMLVDLAYNETGDKSEFFAKQIKNKILESEIKTLPNPHRRAGFAVLKAPDIPSLLLEMGFMSNRKDAELLSDDKYLKKILNPIAEGINAYFEQVEMTQ